jgi:hypothetical protein
MKDVLEIALALSNLLPMEAIGHIIIPGRLPVEVILPLPGYVQGHTRLM